jgi:hypothetical protein
VKGTSYKATDLYGLTKKVVKSVADDSDWINLYDLFEECANEMMHVQEYFANKRNTSTDGGIKNAVFDRRFKAICEKYLHPDSYFRTTLLPHHEQDILMQAELNKLSEDNISQIQQMGHTVKLKGFDNIPDPTPLFSPRDILKYYPMLQFVGYNLMTDIETIFSYINDVDEKKG